MIYLRYSCFHASGETVGVIDSQRLKRFKDLPTAKAFVTQQKENSRFPIYAGTLFRKAKGQEVKLVGYSRDENNDL
jgi:hypothetical protein